MMCSVMICFAAYGDGIDTHTYILLTSAIALGLEITMTAMQGVRFFTETGVIYITKLFGFSQGKFFTHPVATPIIVFVLVLHLLMGIFLVYSICVEERTPENKGYFQSVILQAKYVGTFLTLIVVMICFSGPLYTCIGYEKDPSVPCSTEQHILNQNPLSQNDPDN